MSVKDVLMGIPKSDLLGMTVAVLPTVGYGFSAVQSGLILRRYSNLNFRNWTHFACSLSNFF